MTINRVIAKVDELKPNAFGPERKVEWISALEGRIAADVLLMGIEDVQQFQYTWPQDGERDLLVKFPHDDIYALYVMAQIDAANDEPERYQNSMILFNDHYSNFVRWFAGHYEPANGCGSGVVKHCCVPEYYITAYGLAVQEGFQGTLTEWLASLKGTDGVTPQLHIGSVTVLGVGQKPYVTITGTIEAPVLNFALPVETGVVNYIDTRLMPLDEIIDDIPQIQTTLRDAAAVAKTLRPDLEEPTLADALAALLPKSGGAMAGNVDFGKASHHLAWTTDDGTIINLRSHAPTNAFQITMQNPATGVAERGVLNIATDGTIRFSGDVYASGAGRKLVGYDRSADSWNDAVETGFYAPATDGPNEGAWFGYAIDRGNGLIVQTAFLRGNNSYVYHAQRSSADGGKTWGEWEWENPPMYLGVEYLTTERWNGKPVYTKLIDCGKTTTAEYAKTAQTGLTSGAIIRHNAVNMTAGVALPKLNDSFSFGPNLWVTVDTIEYVAVWCGEDAVGAQVYCQIWYVKD